MLFWDKHYLIKIIFFCFFLVGIFKIVCFDTSCVLKMDLITSLMVEIESESSLISLLNSSNSITNVAFQGINLLRFTDQFLLKNITDCLFVGCVLGEKLSLFLMKENFIFPSLKLPYNTHPVKLYSYKDLYFGFDHSAPKSYLDTLDSIVYQHYKQNGKDELTLRESIGRRMHDHGITNALSNYLSKKDPMRIVAIMGGHSIGRDDESYRKVATIAAALHKKGFLMISGGGPGAMEATHLGVWLSDRKNIEWDQAFGILAEAPSYKDDLWLSKAFEVMEKFPSDSKNESLGIPTWLYGHEPPTPFATHIAKYFANSVREDGLLAIAKGGIVFSPGSAGTIQEIFQDATQNHYLTEEVASPMVFLGKEFWENKYPIYPLLEKLTSEGKYKNLELNITDQESVVVKLMEDFQNSL